MITSSKVHLTIQEMNNKLSNYDKAITIHDIANELEVSVDEVLHHINTLHDLHYLVYADRKKGKISLTNAGRDTAVPT